MLKFTVLTTCFLIAMKGIAYAQDDDCKTVTTVENFDIDQYVSAPWFVQQQAQNAYSPLEQFFCTQAEYEIKEDPSFWGYTVSVYNQAQYETGASVSAELCAYQTDEAASKLAVAPCFLPKIFAGPYWVVAYNETEGYALISGGQPDIPTGDGLCTSGSGINNSGLWIFTRAQERDDDLVEKVRIIALEAGFDLDVLLDVDQTSCEVCADNGGTFEVGWLGEKDCEYIGSKWWGCYFFDEECPETCGKCPS